MVIGDNGSMEMFRTFGPSVGGTGSDVGVHWRVFEHISDRANGELSRRTESRTNAESSGVRQVYDNACRVRSS